MGLLRNAFYKFKQLVRRYSLSPYGWKGDFATWQLALKSSGGYEAHNIVQKVEKATLEVLAGKAHYERDSVVFTEPSYSFPFLSYITFAYTLSGNKLNVVDFGGSLGSSYLQHRPFFDRLDHLSWNIVEQQSFVESGKRIHSDNRLTFFDELEVAIVSKGRPDLLLISSTLQYLQSPYDFLQSLLNKRIRFLLIDNTPFNYEDRDRITVQKVNPSIYAASYPCWFLSPTTIRTLLETQYEILSGHQNESTIYLDGRPIRYCGFFCELKTSK